MGGSEGKRVGIFVGLGVKGAVGLFVGGEVTAPMLSHGVLGKQASPGGHSDEDPLGHGLIHDVDAS